MEQRAVISFEELLQKVNTDGKKYPRNAEGKLKYPIDVVKAFANVIESERTFNHLMQLVNQTDFRDITYLKMAFRSLCESDRTFDNAMKLNLIYDGDRFIQMPEELGVPVEQRKFDNLLKVKFLAEDYQAFKVCIYALYSHKFNLKDVLELVSRGAELAELFAEPCFEHLRDLLPSTFDDLLKCKEWFGLKDKEVVILFVHLPVPERKFLYLQQLNLNEAEEGYRIAFDSLPLEERRLGLIARAASQNENDSSSQPRQHYDEPSH